MKTLLLAVLIALPLALLAAYASWETALIVGLFGMCPLLGSVVLAERRSRCGPTC